MRDFHLEQARIHYTNALKYPQGDAHHNSIQEIHRHLSADGYDLNDDTTYALLDQGLTKAKFDELTFIATTHMITKMFVSTQAVDTRNYGGWLVPGRRFHAMKELIRLLDEHADAIENHSDAIGTDRYHNALLDFVMTEYRNGGLKTYQAALKVDYAVHKVENLQDLTQQVLAAQDRGDLDHYLRQATDCARTLDGLMAELDKGQRDEVLQRTDQTKKTLKNSRQTLALTFARYAVTHDIVPKWEPIFLGYQSALEELEDAGVNLNAKSTFKAIGMDAQTFWDNYRKQVEWMNESGRNYGARKIYTPAPKP
ncbi:hypothetical protein [Micavibrio aeruginosavorus]|uniref:Uncharacterized protein n=1 Tax=Micavibrio aeruginosavorus EPB TaxID=349215 RepID=M4VKC2_9BACT|nr:hypothetical protein [Micavibrio aeruginosavorus]AGH98521.1 hypothetical protein A11S_1719 [Micavibrio aeruginosavorus EPB]